MAERIVEDRTTNGSTARQVVLAEGDDHRLQLLRQEVSMLVRDLPGALTGVMARIGDSQLEITWAGAAPAPGPEAAVVAVAAAGPAPAPAEPVAPREETGKTVSAPLVGTFYHAPEPGARPFIEVGERVVAGQTIGIVEAMKLMNHVASEWTGTVTEILASDATAVEFGQPLIRVEPAES
jgi:acetyl-CoA carboxylase biotin carboxyl carrier protein